MIDDVTWYYSNSGFVTQVIGTKGSNQLGLYDMSGNILEYCWDWHDWPSLDYYNICFNSGTVSNPYGPVSGGDRILRCGCFASYASLCRVAGRFGNEPHDPNYNNAGFRIVRTSK